MLLTGPGTTNHAESYHGKLRDHFPRSHPLLFEWLVVYRELSHHEEERAAAIERGDQQLRQGLAVSDDLKRRRLQLRTTFDNFLQGDLMFDQNCILDDPVAVSGPEDSSSDEELLMRTTDPE